MVKWFSKKKNGEKIDDAPLTDLEKGYENKTYRQLRAEHAELFRELDKEGKERFDYYRKVLHELIQQPENKQNERLLDLIGALLAEIEGTHVHGEMNSRELNRSMNLHIQTLQLTTTIGENVQKIIKALTLAGRDIRGNTAVLMAIEDLKKQGEGMQKVQGLLESMIADEVENQRQQENNVEQQKESPSQNPLSG
jgi:hypothetical protein